jgi:4-alpha-glucanotransferase
MPLDELRRRALAAGVATSFDDAAGQHHEVSAGTLEAVLAAMGADEPAPPRPRPPVVVLRRGSASSFRPDGQARLVLESGEERPVPAELPGDLPLGYHRVDGDGCSTLLVVAPPRCHLPAWLDGGGRAWGFAAQLYAARSRQSWGFGDLGDLVMLAGPEVAGELGAAFVLLNPLHAAAPSQPSPYFPSSRLFRNPLYLRVEAVPELARLDEQGRRRVAELGAAGRRLGADARIDREACYRLKDEALRRCHQALDGDQDRLAGLAAYRAATQGVDDFATFCGLQHELGPDWRAWPVAYRHPGNAAVHRWAADHPGEVRYHAWLQWLLEEQLAAVPPLPVGVLGDLAVGVDPGGFDAWTFQGELAKEVTVGAPPDPLGPHGQDWGLPPFVPARLAATDYQPFVRTVRAGMAGVQGLRIDHVMGLFRLFWVPEGRPPAEGTYVHYPAADLLGVLALESGRARALVIGEDLGTVAPGVREQLAAERVLSYRLAWFERDAGGRRRAADYPRLALTAATTHDLPTVTGFFSGEDLAHLHGIGVVSDADLAGATASQRADREELIALLIAEGVLAPEHAGDLDEVRVALYAFLARTPSMLVAATLEDAVGTSDRPNVPGTVDQYPNWSLLLPVLLDDLAANPRVRRLASALTAERPLPPTPP